MKGENGPPPGIAGIGDSCTDGQPIRAGRPCYAVAALQFACLCETSPAPLDWRLHDNWMDDLRTTFATAGAFAPPEGSRDAACVVELAEPGAYTVQAREGRGQAGELLSEVYELDSPP